MNQEQQRMFAGVAMNTIAKEYDQTRPAFPCPPVLQSNGFYSSGNGMSLRDYFAAAALHGFLSNAETSHAWNESDVARFCYFQADAMIKAREVKP